MCSAVLIDPSSHYILRQERWMSSRFVPQARDVYSKRVRFALLLACSFLLFVHAEMSDVRKAGRVEGQSVAAILFGKMQADRFRQMDQRGISRAGTTNKPDRNAGAAFSVGCR